MLFYHCSSSSSSLNNATQHNKNYYHQLGINHDNTHHYQWAIMTLIILILIQLECNWSLPPMPTSTLDIIIVIIILLFDTRYITLTQRLSLSPLVRLAPIHPLRGCHSPFAWLPRSPIPLALPLAYPFGSPALPSLTLALARRCASVLRSTCANNGTQQHIGAQPAEPNRYWC